MGEGAHRQPEETAMLRHPVLAVIFTVAVYGAVPGAVRGSVVVHGALSTVGVPFPESAATERFGRLSQAETAAPLAADIPLSYEHFPRILDPGETGTIRVVVEVVGDVQTVLFRRNVPTADLGRVVETWRRSGTRNIDGRVVSSFTEDYPASILSDLLVYAHGNDFPQVPLGRLEAPGKLSAEPDFVTLWLRLAPSNLPTSTVRLLTVVDGDEATAQYASHVVNLVIPGFGDERIQGGVGAFAFQRAARAFYDHFSDQYQTLTFVPRKSPLGESEQMNVNVMNDIAGTGMPLVDDRVLFDSEVLRSVQLLSAGFLAQRRAVLHQLAHHWGDMSGLADIAGVVSAGFDPETHTPLVHPGATMVGAVLDGTREIRRFSIDAGDVFRVAASVPPVLFHPLQLYRMGFLGPAQIPDTTVFERQGQFDPIRVTAPVVGTEVVGPHVTIGINDIMAALGPREGPVFSEWNQAFVVVSDELVSQREMDYFNFYAKRAEAPTGTRSYDGFGSFREATGGRASMRTRIEPRDPMAHLAISENLDVRDVPFGAGDWRGVILDDPLPSRLRRGSSLTLSGRIDSKILPDNYQFFVLRVSRYGDPAAASKWTQSSVTGGRFAATLRIGSLPGAYAIDAFVFADAKTPPITTSAVTSLFVD